MNGVFFGDGSGCASTCTKEPVCRDPSGHNQACAAVCGDGNVDTGEGCDDGNRANGDGCSSACTVEAGYTCTPTPKPATAPCAAGGGSCLALPVIYRDFASSHEAGGHPDFAYQSPGGTPCVPDASGPAHCGMATPRSWGIVQDTLVNGKPQLNGSPVTTCSFVDWSHDTNGGHVPGYSLAESPLSGLPYMAGPSGHPAFLGSVPLVKDKASFDQWFNDSPGSSPPNAHTVGVLELAALGDGRYRFSSGLDSVVGGFFPLDPVPPPTGPGPNAAGEPFLCNLFPYWFSSAQFGAGNGCRADQHLYPPSIPAAVQTAMSCAGKTPPGCVDGAWVTNVQGQFHDFWFTYESHTVVTVPSNGFELQVYATDDLFVFLNGSLVIDLGGTHAPIPGRVTVTGTGTAISTEGGFIDANHAITSCPSGDPADPMNSKNCPKPVSGDDCRSRTVPLSVKQWQTYELAVFGAQRHPTQSTLEIVVSGTQKLASVCSK